MTFFVLILGANRRHRSLQYFTCSQSRAHFLRQVKGRPQVGQVFCGRSDFFTPFGMRDN